ncbi:MAG: outer membrane protein assembly factor BamC, partial [Pseudomonadales bacterium]|nr:outer membrane protein assembly factor BamC [Pseudomonadales bacterium]
SDWIVGGNGSADQVFAAMRGDKSAVTLPASARYKFRVRIEPGIRSGSTEIYLEEHSLPLGDLVSTGVDWTGTSDNTELEGVALNSIAYYLGDEINRTPSFSMLATNIGGQRAELIPDRLKPVLKYKLPFDRAWATVGDALEQAKINVEDLDRSSAIYYVYYDAEHAGEPGFFSRLFQGDEAKAERNDKNRYIVRLDAREKTDEVDVTVMKDAKTLANADVAEQLLKIIKEYST